MAPALTRRRDRDRPQECWRVHYGDVQVGAISECVGGNPGAATKWQWNRGFYPGSRPGECSSGTAMSFEAARSTSLAAWREHQAWTAEKYRRFNRGERMATDWQGAL